MLQDKSIRSPLSIHGFILAIESDDEVINPEQIANKLSDALAWIEGVGTVDITYMGQFEEEDESHN